MEDLKVIAKSVSVNSLEKVLSFIQKHVQRLGNRKFRLNIQEFASFADVSPTTLIAAIKDLESAKILKVEREGPYRYGSVYTYLGEMKTLNEIEKEERIKRPEDLFVSSEEKLEYYRGLLEIYSDFTRRIIDVREEKDCFVLTVQKKSDGTLGIPLTPKI